MLYGHFIVIGRALRDYVQRVIHRKLSHSCTVVSSQLPISGFQTMQHEGCDPTPFILGAPKSSHGFRGHSFDVACYVRKRQVLDSCGRLHPCGDRERAGRFDNFLYLINHSAFMYRAACPEGHEIMGGMSWLRSVGPF